MMKTEIQLNLKQWCMVSIAVFFGIWGIYFACMVGSLPESLITATEQKLITSQQRLESQIPAYDQNVQRQIMEFTSLRRSEHMFSNEEVLLTTELSLVVLDKVIVIPKIISKPSNA